MADYNPRTFPTNPADIPSFSQEEQRRLAQAISAPSDYFVFNVQNRLPKKYIDGMTFRASATLAAANPLVLTGGAGMYTYYDGSFKKLG